MNNSNSLVSVIVNCYNSQKYLEETICSVLDQAYINFELVIVDNCSVDKTKEIIFSFNDNRIKYFKTANNINLSSARNFALSKCKGTYIAFLDSDDIWLKNKLKNQIDFLEKNKKFGALFSNCFLIDSESKKIGTYIRKIEKGSYSFSDLIREYNVNLQTFIVRSDILLKNKIKFDNLLKVAEDLDFILRISYFSDLYCDENFLAKYRIHQNQDSYTYKSLFYEEEKYVLSQIFSDYSIKIKDYFEEISFYSTNSILKNINVNQQKNSKYINKHNVQYKIFIKKLIFLFYIPKFFKKYILMFLNKI